MPKIDAEEHFLDLAENVKALSFTVLLRKNNRGV